MKFLKRKLRGSMKSVTMAVASLLVALGVWVQNHPAVLDALVPERWEGVAIASVGLIVALARLRTLGRDK